MRPILLRIAGFTSFRDQQEVDFTDLDLFAITGPTGSGKSSVLDAITYALYGKAERVGDRVRQLVSQGQPSAQVELTFDVDGDGYRVTRLTRAGGGGARILLERRETGGAWVQFGPGADRIREAEAEIVKLIGLDYTGFTRSVLLPQGQFHRFLSGEAHERRDILTDLLGLRLYERMSTIANQQGALANVAASTTANLLETEYGDVSAAALAAARTEESAAKKAVTSVRAARTKLETMATRLRDTERELSELSRLNEQAAELGTQATAIAERIQGLSDDLGIAKTAATAQEAVVTNLGAEAAAAQEREADVEAHGGSLQVLDDALRRISEAQTNTATATSARADAALLSAGLGALRIHISEAEADLDGKRGEESHAKREIEAAQIAREEMQSAHQAASLVAESKIGDPCPICGRPLDALPVAPGADEVRTAEARLARGRANLLAATAACSEAETVVRDRTSAVAADETRIATLTAQAVAAGERAESALKGVRAAVKLGPKDDPETAIATRRAELVAAGAATDAANALLAAGQIELATRRNQVGLVIASVSAQRDTLAALGLSGVATLARAALREEIVWPVVEPESESTGIRKAAVAIAAIAAKLADSAQSAAQEGETRLAAALTEASKIVEPLAIRGESVTEIAAAAEALERSETGRLARASTGVTSAQSRLERRTQLESTIVRDQARAATMRTLALALRSDRLVAFVQAEALERLAAAAATHLENLTSGRYRLVCTDDDFEVVDTWNGDERRNVRTLSGGETFLASLALSLALAQEMSTMAVGGHARLDSLFLDEGFGSLDPETLETVTGAVEALREGGRLVGIITHIGELADRMPTRFVVRKSPRGSRIAREDALSDGVLAVGASM